MFVGLVAAKENSKRFKNKNIHPVNGYPMFWHSVKPLIESKLVEEVYVLTDSDFIKQYCHEKGVKIIHRPYNASRSEDKLISVLRYGYYNLDQEYDGVVTIMANCPGHSSEQIDFCVSMLKDKGLNEVRSFNKSGEESGLIVFSKYIMESNQDVSYYIGGVTDEVTEIHYQSDLENL
jgi:CMP-N-acetylneuraminic acid synthetase